ncbi:MAG: hypothetical protein K2W96_24520, partial [Gemmataceae bacterium]|nr:hypothetical protein [Gemmataceae bacterium]
AAKSEGSFAAIPQEGGVVAIDTPFDARLAEINAALTKTVVVAGEGKARREAGKKLEEARALSAPAAADRAGFAGKTGAAGGGGFGGGFGVRDLLDDAIGKDGKADMKKVKELKDAELPEEFKKLKTDKERSAYLEKKAAERAKLNKEAVELDKKRSDHIAAEMKKKGKGKDSFDSNVLEMLKKQSKKFEIEF